MAPPLVFSISGFCGTLVFESYEAEQLDKGLELADIIMAPLFCFVFCLSELFIVGLSSRYTRNFFPCFFQLAE